MQTYAYVYDFRFLSCTSIYSYFAGLLLETVYYCVI